jgi:hypothetical protein
LIRADGRRNMAPNYMGVSAMTAGHVDPDALTGYQKVLLEGWPAAHLVGFGRFLGAYERAKAVADGKVEDTLLLDLIEKLGASCPDVDTAARHVTEAADSIGLKFREAGGGFGETSSGDDVVRYFGPLREIAAKMWRLDDSEWRENPMYRPPGPRS